MQNFHSDENTSRKIQVPTGLPLPGDTCHTIPLLPGWIKMQVDSVLSAYEKTPLPKPTQEATFLIEAKSSMVPWREDLVEIVKTIFLFIPFSNCKYLLGFFGIFKYCDLIPTNFDL